MQLRVATWLLITLIALPAGAADPPASSVTPRTSDDKIMYALGLSLAERVQEFELSPEELALVQAGLQDGVAGGDTQVSLAQWAPRVEKKLQLRREQIALRQRQEAAGYLSAAAAEAGAVKRASGLIFRELRAGTGPRPAASDRVKVHYQGTRIDGSVFDSSIERGRPSTFGLDGVIRCWTEALQMMQAGAKAKLVCPAAIAYGRKGLPGRIKPGATLTFDVELLEILGPEPAAPEQ
jgi:FKBP-type peptidyl-prolyl cis-trans isomerase